MDDRPIIVCELLFVGVRPTTGCDADVLVGVRPIAGASSCCDAARPTAGASSCGDAAGAVDDRPIIVCELLFVGVRPTTSCDADVLVGVRPIAGASSCCDAARPTAGSSCGDAAGAVDDRPIIVCELLFVGARPTTGCDADVLVGVRPIAGAVDVNPIIVCELFVGARPTTPDCVGARPTAGAVDPIIVCELWFVGARFVIARGNGGGTAAGRVVARPITVWLNAAAFTGASESGIAGVPLGRRCGIGGGCGCVARGSRAPAA